MWYVQCAKLHIVGLTSVVGLQHLQTLLWLASRPDAYCTYRIRSALGEASYNMLSEICQELSWLHLSLPNVWLKRRTTLLLLLLTCTWCVLRGG